MAEQQQIYKTVVTCSIGFSIETGDNTTGHSWEKSNVSVSTESGPGYPSQENMRWMLTTQMNDAVDGCNQQIEMVAQKVMNKAQQ